METNTGKQRATKLVVTKKSGSQVIYVHTYYITDAFSTYAAITSAQLARLSISEYTARAAAFKTYVDAREVGLSLDMSASYVTNTSACPIPLNP